MVAWPLLLLLLTYAFWRYAYMPWKALYADVRALHQQLEEHKAYVKSEFGLRKVIGMDDEDLAHAEARALAKSRWGREAR